MLTANNVVLTTRINDEEVPLKFIKECFIRIASDSFCIYVETLDKADHRKHYTVTSITNQNDRIHINLLVLDHPPQISENEKVVDIRELSHKPR